MTTFQQEWDDKCIREINESISKFIDSNGFVTIEGNDFFLNLFHQREQALLEDIEKRCMDSIGDYASCECIKGIINSFKTLSHD